MAVTRNYSCSVCMTQQEREDLTVKKAAFFEMGVGGKAIRSRVIAHLCPKCLVEDQDFQRPAFVHQTVPMKPVPSG